MGDVGVDPPTGELENVASTSSESRSSRRRLRTGDSQFDSELGNIFDTCVRTFPIIDWKKEKKNINFLFGSKNHFIYYFISIAV